MSSLTRRELLGGALAASAIGLSRPALADPPAAFSLDEVIDSGHRFFGAVSRGLAEIVQEAGRRWGLPNGYILGQE
ncbi:MAG TPA: EipA family protein, partial [Roseiarcus sp.]|nr:EipA family protein [Roseiarcus sp.]